MPIPVAMFVGENSCSFRKLLLQERETESYNIARSAKVVLIQ